MPRNPNQTVEIDVPFPVEGLEETRAFFRQRQGTSADMANVRGFDPKTDRARGGQRPGLAYFMSTQVVGDYPIQDINNLVTTDKPPSLNYAQFIYALAASNGYGIGNGGTGASIATDDAQTGYAFACSCWDNDGNAYVGQVNTTTGATRIRKISAAGVVAWTLATVLVTTGTLRNLAGMAFMYRPGVVHTDGSPAGYLFLAVKDQTTGAAAIHRINANTGAVANASWTRHVATTHILAFSTGSHNCLGVIGTTLGVENAGNGTNQSFRTYNGLSNPVTTSLTNTAWGGTLANQASKVVSDGVANFYVIASVTTNMLKRISVGGVLAWSYTSANTITSVTIDTTNSKLICTAAVTPSFRVINMATGALVTSADPGTVTLWHEIGSDNQGTNILWRNAVASNDIVAVDNAGTVLWGPSTFANTTHSGASTNKGAGVPDLSRSTTRVSILVSVSNGEVRILEPAYSQITGDPQYSSRAVTDGTAFAPNSPTVFSAQNGLNLHFADGSVYKRYVASTNSISAWTPTAGTLPVDANDTKARGIETWRGRTVLFGLRGNPQNFYMSKQYDPLDWDYSPSTTTAQQAFAGNDSLAGFTGDLINGFVPYDDDTGLFLCDHSIWQMTGDPMNDGTLDGVSSTIGGAWGRAWALDPSKQVFFFGSDCAIYKMMPGTKPTPMSGAIARRLQGIDLSKHLIRMCWDTVFKGLWVFVTPYDVTQKTTNFFWEERTNAWMPDFFGDLHHQPFSIFTLDGDLPNDRVVIIGGKDGYLRFVTEDADDDTGEKIQSYVMLGPIRTQLMDMILFKDIQITLGETSGEVKYKIFVGKTAEAALTSEAVVTGTFMKGGRNPVAPVRRSGMAVYVELSAEAPWALEKLTARYQTLGMVLRRSS